MTVTYGWPLSDGDSQAMEFVKLFVLFLFLIEFICQYYFDKATDFI